MYNIYIGQLNVEIESIKNRLFVFKNQYKMFKEEKDILEPILNTIVSDLYSNYSHTFAIDADITLSNFVSKLLSITSNDEYINVLNYVNNLRSYTDLFKIIDEIKTLVLKIYELSNKMELYKVQYNNFREKGNKLVKSKLGFYNFKYLLNEINREFFHQTIIKNSVGGFGGIGDMRIKKVPNQHITNIDFPESKKYRTAVVKEKDPELYSLYESGVILYDEFHARSKKYFYSKDNPNGIKWLLKRTNGFDCYIAWRKKGLNIKNIKKFAFVPSNGCNERDENGLWIQPKEVASRIKDIEELKYVRFGAIPKMTTYFYYKPELAII